MKKSFLIFLTAVISVSGYGQKLKSGSFDGIFSEGRINVKIDYSKAMINGYTEEELLDSEIEMGKDWKNGKPEVNQKFIFALNEKAGKNVSIGSYKNTKYTIVYYPLTIDKDGDQKAYATVVDENGETILETAEFKASGGHIGTFMNLVGDGMDSAGERLGYFFRSAYYASKKKK